MTINRKFALAAAIAGPLSLPLAATADVVNVVKVVVPYTTTAVAWANANQISCDNPLPNENGKIAQVTTLTGIVHVCAEDLTLARGNSPIDNLIAIAIAEANQVYRNSGITNLRLELADSFLLADVAGTPYQEGIKPGDIAHSEPFVDFVANEIPIANELLKLRNRDDAGNSDAIILNQIHTRRAQVQGDIVVLLNGDTINDGYDLFPVEGLAAGIGVKDPREGFTALSIEHAIAPSYAFAHEVSHLFGANHYEIRTLPIIGAQDVIAGTPDFVSPGKIDAWGYQNTDYSTPYQTLMAYSCVNCLGLPILSTLNPGPGVSTAIPYGYAAVSSSEISRNNARVVANAASTVAAFGEQLAALQDPAPASAAIGIDFGYDTTAGWNINPTTGAYLYVGGLDFKTYDADCNEGTGAGCDEVWNNVTDPENLSEIPLKNKNGVVACNGTTGCARIAITRKFYGASKAPYAMQALFAAGLDEMPTMAMADGFTAIRLYTLPRFELRGLDPAKRYFFKIFSSNAPTNSVRVVKYELKGATATGASHVYNSQLPSHGNIMRFARVSGVYPDANGTIEFTVNPDMNSVPFFTSVSLNAIEFYAEQ